MSELCIRFYESKNELKFETLIVLRTLFAFDSVLRASCLALYPYPNFSPTWPCRPLKKSRAGIARFPAGWTSRIRMTPSPV